MKKIILLLLMTILLGLGVFVYFDHKPALAPSSPLHAPSPTTGNVAMTYCVPSDLKASLSLSPGAGNIYGTFTLQNVSQKTCQVRGNAFVTPVYNMTTITNIAVTHVGNVEKDIFALAPEQTIYSQVHYPNGPQCSGPTKSAQVQFVYTLSATDSITYATSETGKEQQVAICTDPSEVTTIEIWNMSTKPIVQ